MKFILGTKDGMTQVFDETGVAHPVTIVRVASNVVTAVKTKETNGYEAVQVGTVEQKESRVAKAQQKAAFAHTKEFRVRHNGDESVAGFEHGQTLDASVFTPGDLVQVSAESKGKGFQGVVKRHGFGGGRRTHGQKHSEREPGSIGATGFGRVIKGLRMAGRMGGDRITVKNLTVMQVNPADNVLLIKGAIPGRKGSLVEVRSV